MKRRAKELGLILVAGGMLAFEIASLQAVLPGVTRAVAASGIPAIAAAPARAAVAALPKTHELPAVLVEVRSECVVKAGTCAKRVRHEVRETVVSTLREAVL
jgi:hypothetical protein